MFKTIEETRLELVAHSVAVAPVRSLNYYMGKPATDPLDQGIIFPSEQNLDFFPCSAARVSFGNEDKTGEDKEKDLKLMQYLADHEHMSPFEHQSATFLVEVPLFIRSQIMRHRTFAYNEISRRYTDENLEFWIPTTFRKQSDSNRQASTDEQAQYEGYYIPGATTFKPEEMVANMKDMYVEMIDAGVCREQARAYLPQSLLTKFYMTGNLRNWAHFVKLRTHDGAQYEVRVVAERISAELGKLWPNAWGVVRGHMD